MTRHTETLTERGIPRGLAPFLQEYDVDKLDPKRARDTLIERTLRYGNRAEIRWLFHCYGERSIAEWVRRWGHLALPRVHLVFCGCY
jgi:hypothetical protein